MFLRIRPYEFSNPFFLLKKRIKNEKTLLINSSIFQYHKDSKTSKNQDMLIKKRVEAIVNQTQLLQRGHLYFWKRSR